MAQDEKTAVPEWQEVPLVSGRTARRMLATEAGTLHVSLDLGLTEDGITAQKDVFRLPDGTRVPRGDLEEAFGEPEDCVRLAEGDCRKVYRYSDARKKFYKLYQPFEDDAPTIVINGMTMHAITRTDPWTDAQEKVQSVPERAGRCLDTCCGLGYTAQILARRFGRVTTCEVDANVLAVASVNPWSRLLFQTSNLEVRQQDVRYLLAEVPEGHFACIFHDPPTVYLAGQLYSEVLYRRFLQVLERGGVLYHYVGVPGERRGQDYARGVMRRLREAGFKRVERAKDGVKAVKKGAGRPLR